jgi:lipopolysaccharide transport system permease protein
MAVPASSVTTSLVDFVLSAGLLALLMAWYQYLPGPRVLFLPGFVLLALGAALGMGLWLSALTVQYRDFRFIVPFIVQFGLYLSPVGFSSDVVPRDWRLLYSLNPMVGVIDGFRWAILHSPVELYWPGLLLSLTVVSLLLVTGISYFRKTERSFADVI